MGRCCCCKREIDLWDSNQLEDGEICNDCYRKVLAVDHRVDQLELSKRKCQDIRALYLSSFEKKEGEAQAPPETPFSKNPEKPENPEKVVERVVYVEKQPEKTSHPVRTFLEIALVCVGLYLWLSGNYITVAMDVMAAFSTEAEENPYIQMVATAQPEGVSKAYGAAFGQCFSKNFWSYFKSGDVRIVQVRSSYDGIDEELITQFKLTPTEEKGMFWIEVYSMELNGKRLSEAEASIILAAIYKDDLMNVFANSILSSMFY